MKDVIVIAWSRYAISLFKCQNHAVAKFFLIYAVLSYNISQKQNFFV